MTTRIYPLDFYEVTKPGINVSPNTANGPGELVTSTDLTLYGQGYQQWGEQVNENTVKLAENFAGSTAPINPVEGQMWYAIKHYHFNTLTSQWSAWNHSTWQWEPLPVTNAPTAPTPVIGQYYYNTVSERLYRADRLYDTVDLDWIDRVYSKAASEPPTTPGKTLSVYDGQKWNPLTAITASDTRPDGIVDGQMWFDTVNKRLWLYNLSSNDWIEIFLTNGRSKMVDTLTINSKNITNLGTATDATDAVTKQTIANLLAPIGTQISSSLAAHIADDSKHTISAQDHWLDGITISSEQLISLKGLTGNVDDQLSNIASSLDIDLAGKLDRSGGTMTGPLKLLAPTTSTHYATKLYFDDNCNLNEMLNVTVPPGGMPDKVVLKWNATTLRWEPVAQTTVTGLTISASTYYAMPGDVITLGARISTSDGVSQVVTNVTYTVNGVSLGAATSYTVPAGAGATLSFVATLVGSVIVDGVPYTGLVSAPWVTYVATSLEVTGPTSLVHYGQYAYAVKSVFSNGVKQALSGTFSWTLGGVGLAASTGSITVPTSVPPGSRALEATYKNRTGSLTTNVAAVAGSLTISGPTSLNENTSGSYSIVLTYSDGSTQSVTSSASVSVSTGSWSAGTYTAPNVSANMGVNMTASYAGKSDSRQITVINVPVLVYNYGGWYMIVGGWAFNGNEQWNESASIIAGMQAYGIYETSGWYSTPSGRNSDGYWICNGNGTFYLSLVPPTGPPWELPPVNVGRRLRIVHGQDSISIYIDPEGDGWTLYTSHGRGNTAVIRFGVYV